jgi:hypothetical protein
MYVMSNDKHLWKNPLKKRKVEVEKVEEKGWAEMRKIISE